MALRTPHWNEELMCRVAEADYSQDTVKGRLKGCLAQYLAKLVGAMVLAR